MNKDIHNKEGKNAQQSKKQNINYLQQIELKFTNLILKLDTQSYKFKDLLVRENRIYFSIKLCIYIVILEFVLFIFFFLSYFITIPLWFCKLFTQSNTTDNKSFAVGNDESMQLEKKIHIHKHHSADKKQTVKPIVLNKKTKTSKDDVYNAMQTTKYLNRISKIRKKAFHLGSILVFIFVFCTGYFVMQNLNTSKAGYGEFIIDFNDSLSMAHNPELVQIKNNSLIFKPTAKCSNLELEGVQKEVEWTANGVLNSSKTGNNDSVVNNIVLSTTHPGSFKIEYKQNEKWKQWNDSLTEDVLFKDNLKIRFVQKDNCDSIVYINSLKIEYEVHGEENSSSNIDLSRSFTGRTLTTVNDNEEKLLHWNFEQIYDRCETKDEIENLELKCKQPGNKNLRNEPGLHHNSVKLDARYLTSKQARNYLNGLDEITVSVWAKPTFVSSDYGLITTNEPDNTDNKLGLRYDEVGQYGGCKDCIKASVLTQNGYQQLESSSNLQEREWTHILMTWKSGENLRLYVNGEEDVPSFLGSPVTGGITGVENLYVGRGTKFTNRTDFKGSLDELEFYNFALSTQEVQSLYNSYLNNIDILTPSAQDLTLIAGSYSRISWYSSKNVGTVKLEYSSDDFTNDINLIAESVPDNGEYIWNIPNNLESENIKLRITHSLQTSNGQEISHTIEEPLTVKLSNMDVYFTFDSQFNETNCTYASDGTNLVLLPDCNTNIPSLVPSLNSNAMALDGNDDYILVNDNAPTNAFTRNIWVKPVTLPENSGEKVKFLDKTGSYYIDVDDTKLNIGLYDAKGDENILSVENTFINLDEWSMITVSNDGNYLRFYVDGYLYADSRFTAELGTNINDVVVGKNASTSGEVFNGHVDGIGLWDRALSNEEILQLYNIGQNTKPAVQNLTIAQEDENTLKINFDAQDAEGDLLDLEIFNYGDNEDFHTSTPFSSISSAIKTDMPSSSNGSPYTLEVNLVDELVNQYEGEFFLFIQLNDGTSVSELVKKTFILDFASPTSFGNLKLDIFNGDDGSNIADDILELTWSKAKDISFSKYQIYFATDINSVFLDINSILEVEDQDTNFLQLDSSVINNAGAGYFGVKAIDIFGRAIEYETAELVDLQNANSITNNEENNPNAGDDELIVEKYESDINFSDLPTNTFSLVPRIVDDLANENVELQQSNQNSDLVLNLETIQDDTDTNFLDTTILEDGEIINNPDVEDIRQVQEVSGSFSKLLHVLNNGVVSRNMPSPQITNIMVRNLHNELEIHGRSSTNTEIVVFINSKKNVILKTASDNEGFWTAKHDNNFAELESGIHEIYAVAIDSDKLSKSNFSDTKDFTLKTNPFYKFISYIDINTTITTFLVLLLLLGIYLRVLHHV